MAFLRIEIATRIERNQALTLISELISGADGWIVSHQLFSNLSATINMEIPASGVEGFVSRLKEAGFVPQVQGELPAISHGDVRGCVALTFIHDEPDMKRDVPAFG